LFILIHGGGHSSRCWEPTVDRIDAPVLAIDMPGRGRHPAPLDKVHVADWIDSAVRDIEEADANDAVLVGHSMAGASIPGIVDRVHTRLRHIVFVSCAVPQQGESVMSLLPREVVELSELMVPDPAGSFPGKKYTVETQCYDMDEEQTAFTLEVSVPEAYWPMRDPVDLAGLRQAVPRTWVKLLGDRSLRPELQDVMAERTACTEIIELDSGHMAMISHPQELADVLAAIRSR
jgi:pimeloyl-ACP methyl ester carboxylesterase